MGLFLIDRFRSRGQQLYKILETKEGSYIGTDLQSPEDFLGTPTWPLFHCFDTPKWPP